VPALRFPSCENADAMTILAIRKMLGVSAAGTVLTMALPVAARAQIMPLERMTTWQPGVTYNGGIPSRTTIYRTLAPSGRDDTVAIQEALDNCPANQVVLLAPGTFLIGLSATTADGLHLQRSHITLRGSGPNQTKLVQQASNYSSVISLGHRWIKRTAGRLLTSNALKGTSTLTLSSASGLKVGEIVTINQISDDALRNDTTAPVRKVYWGNREETSTPTSPGRGWFCEQNRPIGQTLEIQSISGNQVTFTTKFHIDFETVLGAHLTRISWDEGGVWDTQVDAVKYSGIEDLALSMGGGGDGGGNFHMYSAAYCWAKNLIADLSLGAYSLDGCFRCEVRDSYLHSTRNAESGGDGYGTEMRFYASDNLFENNVVWNFNKMTVGRASGGGNVWGYNYLQDGWLGNDNGAYRDMMEVGAGPNHYGGSHMELFEGNESFSLGSEAAFGNPIYVTYFRNHSTGSRLSAAPLQLRDIRERMAAYVCEASWWYSYVGNVLGYEGMTVYGEGYDINGNHYNQRQFVYEITASNVGESDQLVPMWWIGYWDGHFWPLVQERTYRHGNYDYVTRSTVWDASNPDHVIPDSLYLPSKPAFFGSLPWPWVTPENAPAVLATLPAKVRFNQIHGRTLVIEDTTLTEGNSGTRALTFKVRLSGASSQPEQVGSASGTASSTKPLGSR
jgi:hypothetical protein